MMHDERQERELEEAKALLRGAYLEEDVYSLDEILSEFSAQQAAQEEAQPAKAAQRQPDKPRQTDWEPPAPAPIRMEDIISHTVGQVLGEQPLYSRTTPVTPAKKEKRPPEPVEETEPEEPSYQEAFFHCRSRCRREGRAMLWTAIPAALLLAVTVLDALWALPPVWEATPLLQAGCLLVLLLAASIGAAGIFAQGAGALLRGQVSCELAASLTVLAAAADCVMLLSIAARPVGLPMAAPAALTLWAVQWGSREKQAALRESLKPAVACGGRSDTVDVFEEDIRRSSGPIDGFYNRLTAQDDPARWQGLLLPLILTAAAVFGVLAAVRQDNWGLLAWNWSVMLTAGVTVSLPLCYALTFRRLAKRLGRSGSAVAGHYAMRRLHRGRRLVAADGDLFPTGTMNLGGMKVFGEEIGKVTAYAAGLARMAGGGWAELFDTLLRAEGGSAASVEELQYFEEGGLRGRVRGETVLLGTAAFMRKMQVTLPQKLSLRTGVFLAVDGELCAVFAVKYQAGETVAWALRALKREGLPPLLAVRDGNITPLMLTRKFGTDAKAVYPPLSERLALSETADQEPCVLLCREGLGPYAEAVLGARRCAQATRWASRCALVGSVLGVLLGFYLTFAGAWASVQPLTMLLYQLLWALPAILAAGWVNRY